MLWSSLNKFKFFTTYNNHVVRGGQWKTESFQAGSHMYNTKRLFLKTPENILKYTNFIGRNVILNFYKIDIYLLFTFVPAAAVIFHMTWKKYIWKLQTKVIKGHSYCHKKQRKATCKRAQQLPTMFCPFARGEKFDRFQTLRNNIQQHATGCANGRNM